jgi:hypothetical protein
MAANDAQGTAAASKGTNGTDLAPAPATGASAAPPASGAPSSADAEGKPQPPEFDIVRVERSGEGVIAGRGAPGATIVLKDGDNELARAVADANGEVVFLPPPLTPGEHALTLQSTLPGAGAGASSQSVKVVVPKAGQQAVTVARAAPEQPAASRSDAGAPKSQPGTPSSAAAPPKPAPAVSIRTAEAEEGGSFYATGSAPPGSQSRLYLNGAFVGKVIADLNGLWSLKVEKGMQPGHYAVRADEVEAGSGKVIARAEVPFDFPVAAPTGPVSSPATPVKGPVDRRGVRERPAEGSAGVVPERRHGKRSWARGRRRQGSANRHRRARRQPLADQQENARPGHTLHADLRGQCEPDPQSEPRLPGPGLRSAAGSRLNLERANW